MKRRKGLAAIGIALIMLAFSGIAAVFIVNMAQDLHRTYQVLKTDKEKHYPKIVLLSVFNGMEYLSPIGTTTSAMAINKDFKMVTISNQLSETFEVNVFYTAATASASIVVAVDVHYHSSGENETESIMFFY